MWGYAKAESRNAESINAMKRRPRKRMIFKLLLFLLAGAIINVAVAWGCAYFSSEQVWMYPGEWGEEHPTPADVLWVQAGGHELHPNPKVVTWNAVGVQTRIVRLRWPAWVLEVAEAGFEVSLPFVPSAWQISQGWPFSSMYSEYWVRGTSKPPAPDLPSSTTRWAFSSDGLGSWGPNSRRFFALDPIFPGFAINTIFYAAIVWGLFAVPGAVRRRMHSRRATSHQMKIGDKALIWGTASYALLDFVIMSLAGRGAFGPVPWSMFYLFMALSTIGAGICLLLLVTGHRFQVAWRTALFTAMGFALLAFYNFKCMSLALANV